MPKWPGGSSGFVAGDQPELPEGAVVIGAAWWHAHPKEFAEALAIAKQDDRVQPPEHKGGKGLITEGTPPPQSPARLTLTVEEAAAALGISRAFAYDAVKRNQIPHIKIGRRVLVPKAALDRLLAQADDEPDTNRIPGTV